MKYYSLILFFFIAANYTFLNAQQTVFAIIGDFGDGSMDETAVANLVKNWNPQFVITTGDNRYGNTNFDLTVGKDFCEFLAGAEPGIYCDGNGSAINAFFPSTGNHDYTDGGGINEYISYFDLPGAGIQTSGTSGSELYYDFVRGPIHFFVIDSYDAIINGSMTTQQTWLQNQMAASTARWKIVYFHHPPYSSGYHRSSLEMRWPFAQWGADAVLNGHDHTYERLDYDGITYFVNGLGGRSRHSFSSLLPGSIVTYNAEYGAQRVVADDTLMTFSFINVYGDTIDEHALFKARPVNHDPVFSSDTIFETAATEDSTYLNSIGEYASDPDGDSLDYSIISGPTWLSVAPNGDLSGTPVNDDVGLNSWNVEVDDGQLGADQAILQITVISTNQDTVTTGYTIFEYTSNEDNSEPLFIAYPNPVSDRLIVKLNGWEGKKSLTFYNISGKTVYTESIITERVEIDVTSFPKGVYFLKINNENLNDTKEILIQ